MASRSLRPGDLVIEKSGGGEQQPVGRAVLYAHATPAIPTNFAAGLRPIPSVDSRFLAYLFASLYSSGRTRSSINHTTGIQNLDLGNFLMSSVSVPDFSEQRAIADFLDAETARIDSLLGCRWKMLSLLDERFESAVYAAVTHGLKRNNEK